jgi:hypothetical protein
MRPPYRIAAALQVCAGLQRCNCPARPAPTYRSGSAIEREETNMAELSIDIDQIAHLETQVGTFGSIGGLESGGDDMFEYLVSIAKLTRPQS